MTKLYKIILIIFSILNIVKVKFNNIKCANYFIVNNNLKIGNNCIIASGKVVKKNLKSGTIYK